MPMNDQTIIAGDTLELSLSYTGYTASEWSIWVALRGNAAAIDIKDGETGVTVAVVNGKYEITVTPAATELYTPGAYSYVVYLYKTEVDGEETVIVDRKTVDTGAITILADYGAMTSASDARSHVKKVLDAIEAVIEKRASKEQQSYSIAGRSLSRIPLDELLKLRDRYRSEYQQELRALEGIGIQQLRVRL